MKKIMLVTALGLMVSAAVPAFAQNRSITGAATANATANEGGSSALDSVLSSMGQGGSSAKAGISSLLGGDAVAKIMPAAGHKRHGRFNKHGKGRSKGSQPGAGAGSSLITSSPAASVTPSAPAVSHSDASPDRSLSR